MSNNIPYELLAKLIAGQCSMNEQKAADKWISASPENEKMFNDLEKIWSKSESEFAGFRPDLEKALVNVNASIDKIENAKINNRTKNRRLYIRLITAAASVALLITIGLVYKQINKIKILVAINNSIEPMEINLPDGSKVTLNGQSEIHYPGSFNKKVRLVSLKGEAFFEVVKNARTPFEIEAGQSMVRVLGTKFNVNASAKDESTVVTVSEGRVMLASRKEPEKKKVILTQGESGILNSKYIVKEENPDPNFMAWKTGKLVFEKLPLKKVITDIGKYYHIQFEIADSQEVSLPLTVSFLSKEPGDVVKTLELVLQRKIEKKEDTYIITKETN